MIFGTIDYNGRLDDVEKRHPFVAMLPFSNWTLASLGLPDPGATTVHRPDAQAAKLHYLQTPLGMIVNVVS
jgi:hypothetical protein